MFDLDRLKALRGETKKEQAKAQRRQPEQISSFIGFTSGMWLLQKLVLTVLDLIGRAFPG
jgi:hypothetical protein